MQISENHATSVTADTGQPMTDQEFAQLNKELADPATGRPDPTRITALDADTRHRYVTYLISLKRPIISLFVTIQQKQELEQAGYEAGWENEFYQWWLLPHHRQHYQKSPAEPAVSEKKAVPRHPTPHLATPDPAYDRLTRDIKLDVSAVMESNVSVAPAHEVVVLVPDVEEAYDFWLFRYNRKLKTWTFLGVYQNGIFEWLNQQGYYKRYSRDGNSLFFLHDESNIISEVIPARMRDSINASVDANKETVGTDYYSVTYAARSEKLRRTSNSLFNDKTLQELSTHDRPFLQDSPKTCYLPFLNGIVEVSKNGIEIKPYSTLQGACLWKSQVIPRNYNPDALADCDFSDFIDNVTNQEADRKQAFETGIGYAIHSYNSPAEGQAIICCDEELTDKGKPQGGTGKRIYCDAIWQMRPLAYIDGKKFDPTSQFCFQAVNRDTRVVWLDDVKADFSFDRFFSVLTSGWTIEKKNQSAYAIPYREGPKLIICTNTAPNNEGSSNIRRQFILEFSDFYKKRIKPGQKSQPVIEFHGRNFFTDEWDTAEWERFDRYMTGCVLAYMQDGLLPYQTRNVSTNRLLQTTSEEFYAWANSYGETGLQPGQSYKRPDLLVDYRHFASLLEKEFPSRRFTDYIKRYADSKGWIYRLGNSNSNPTFTLENPASK